MNFKKLKKPFLLILGILVLLLLFSQTTLGKRLNLPTGLIEAIRNFFASNPQLHACDYKDGEIILIKPVATGVGNGRYEAGDIVQALDGETLCQRFGNKPFLGEEETTALVPLYYPAKLTEAQKQMLTESEYATTTGERGEIRQAEMLRRRQVGIDYTKFLNTDEILKVRSFENLDKIPEIDLSPIIQKSPDQKSVVQLPENITKKIARGSLIKGYLNKITRKLFPFVFAQTEDVKIVDPDNGAGTNYTSLSGWEAGEEGDLTASNTIAVAKCRSTGGTADSTRVTISGWTTDSTHYIKIWTDPTEGYRHQGKWDDTKYRLSVTGDFDAGIKASTQYVRIDGLQIYISRTSSGVRAGIYLLPAAGTAVFYVSNCIIKFGANVTTAKSSAGILSSFVSGANDFTTYAWNNLIYSIQSPATGNGIATDLGGDWTVFAYNNTVRDAGYGFYAEDQAKLVVKNNISYNNTDNYYAYSADAYASSTNNISGPQADANMPGSNPRNGAKVMFVDEANDDFHLSALDKGAVNYGTNLSSDVDSPLSFTNDIDGQTRPSSGVNAFWDIGADQTLAATIVGVPQTGRLTSGLVGYWTFDGYDMNATTVYDRSGSSPANDGDAQGGAKKVTGINGQALEFDGTDDYTRHGDVLDFALTDQFTVSAWIKSNVPVSGEYDIVSKADSDSPWSGWSFGVEDLELELFYHDDSGNSTWGKTADIDSITNGTWQHVVGVYNNENIVVYINGVSPSMFSANAAAGSTNNAVPLCIGTAEDATGSLFKGIIDEVRIYNRVLSASEIQELYRLGAARLKANTPITYYLTSGLVGNWTFNGEDMNATTAIDRSGNSNDGDVNGGATKVPGNLGQALSFDASDDYVSAGSGASLDNLNQKTLSAWIYPKSAGEGSEGNILGKCQVTVNGWELALCSNAAGECAGITNTFTYQHQFATTDGKWRGSAGAITLNAWNHVAVTYDDTSVDNDPIFYVNGTVVSPTEYLTPDGSSQDDSANVLSLGNRTAGTRTFDGYIDEVRVYNRILSADEIQQLYRLGSRKFKPTE